MSSLYSSATRALQSVGRDSCVLESAFKIGPDGDEVLADTRPRDDRLKSEMARGVYGQSVYSMINGGLRHFRGNLRAMSDSFHTMPLTYSKGTPNAWWKIADWKEEYEQTSGNPRSWWNDITDETVGDLAIAPNAKGIMRWRYPQSKSGRVDFDPSDVIAELDRSTRPLKSPRKVSRVFNNDLLDVVGGKAGSSWLEDGYTSTQYKDSYYEKGIFGSHRDGMARAHLWLPRGTPIFDGNEFEHEWVVGRGAKWSIMDISKSRSNEFKWDLNVALQGFDDVKIDDYFGFNLGDEDMSTNFGSLP